MEEPKKIIKEVPLSVAVAALISDNKILLIKRVRGDYVGFLALPGGKIEKHEHLSEAAIREIFEESGIDSVFKDHLGLVSEHLTEDGKILQHFLLHVCELEPKSTDILNDAEGKLSWFDLDRLHEFRDQVIPSDYLIIEKIVRSRDKTYFDCLVEKNGEVYTLRKFE